MTNKLQSFFDDRVRLYNRVDFIARDPISIPHLFSKKQDIEIAAFFAAIFSWGNRTGIIRKARELMERMDMSPHAFCTQAGPAELKRLEGFCHRTFNSDDLYYFVDFFRRHYARHKSLEAAFSQWLPPNAPDIEQALTGFRRYFFDAEHLRRTEKHIASPERNSSCKRLNMFLRWMVRKDDAGVDFGFWQKIKPAQLICPIDLHVARVARRFQMTQRPQADWQTALEITAFLRRLDPADPVRYDFALFGLGIEEKY
ncbi:MAG TPA: TIGR02757 family protein [Chitinophagaceae bacterium]|nr:TIGR02757 family protein [Chitinophagaceae bacterium]